MILAANTPVLKAMIQSGMRETQSDEMLIENFSLSCVETLLNYFYAYNVNDSVELFQAADFYQLKILKEFCEDNLVSDLDHRNVLEIYSVAKLCNADSLMSIARQEIINQKWKILQDPDWKGKIKQLNDTDLMLDMMQPESQVQVPPRRKNNFVEDFSVQSLRLQQLHHQIDFHNSQQNLLMPYQEKLKQQEHIESLYRRRNKEFFLETFKNIYNEEFSLVDQKPFICVNSEKFYASLEGKELWSNNEKIILKFLYTGEIDSLADHVVELLIISMEMGLVFLKKTCSEHLIETISVENVLERYIMASKYDLLDIAESCFDVIRREKYKILSSPNWRSIVRDNVDLMFEMILKLL